MVHGCTLTTRHYEAQARVLAESFLAHNPGSRFSVLMIGYSPDELPNGERFEVFVPADVGIDERELKRRATMYITQGLASSLKPNLIATLLSRGSGAVLYIDADGCVYDDLTELAELAERHSLLLSPHTLDPHPIARSEPADPVWRQDSPEQIILRSGLINAGLLGAGPRSGPFLEWWAQRTARRCVFDLPLGLALSQTWLTLAMTLFEHHVLLDRGCNVAGWNLQARDVSWVGERPTIDGAPLRHFHFAGGFDPERPHRITPSAKNASWWPSLDERPGTARVAREYADRLIAHGYREAHAAPPLYDVMPGGASIEPWMRATYRIALVEAEQGGSEEPPNPFSDGAERFAEWLQRRAYDRLEGGVVASPAFSDAWDAGTDEILTAAMDSGRLLARIKELDGIRDEAVEWAEREAAELQRAVEAIAARDESIDALRSELAGMRASMDSVWRSPSWRVTKPLRAIRAGTASAATILRRARK
ncbi:MAG TPA: hypothetical protein VIG42_01170 [Solirubrobacteraceae bacterium]|jgi:hypothetical protein